VKGTKWYWQIDHDRHVDCLATLPPRSRTVDQGTESSVADRDLPGPQISDSGPAGG
jgi:hypothetical protein